MGENNGKEPTSPKSMDPIWNLRMMIHSRPRIRVRSPSTTFSGAIRSTLICPNTQTQQSRTNLLVGWLGE